MIITGQTQCKHKTDMTRATKRAMEGQIWPAVRHLDTCVV